MTVEAGPVTELLARSRAGDARARDSVYALVYEELKRIARKQLRGNRQAFQTTALVHESWLKLSVNAGLAPADRNHLMALSSQAMRHVLVDHARHVHSQRRGGGQAALTLTSADVAQPPPDVEVLALHGLLEELQRLDPRAAQVVELRYFGGYGENEIAGILDIGEATVRRDWRKARAWLMARLDQ